MAKAVAKRKLKNSFYAKSKGIKDIKMDAFEEEINGLYKRNGANRTSKIRKEKEEIDLLTRIKKRFILKLAVQSITMVSILVFCLCVKLMNIRVVKNSEICKNIVKEFKTNYSKEEILNYASKMWDRAYFYIDPIIPDKLSQKTVAVFSNMLKKDNIKDSLNKNKVNVYSENTVKVYEEQKKEEQDVVETSSKKVVDSTEKLDSNVDKNVKAIKSSGVEFVKPTTGVITSSFGQREVIFEGVESYHYGTDIANKEGTNILSSIDGTVTVCSTNNETGKYIEVKNGDITTRYCHLSKQLVKVGDVVKKGQEIGKMGETGMATGPHLHFEIMYNRNRVDAEKILKLD